MSRFRVLAADYDGTLAHDGLVSEQTVAALRRLREANVRLLMVTGRRVPSLIATFGHLDLFDAIVLENGALIYKPDTQAVRSLTLPPPDALTLPLRQASIPMEVGYSIVESVQPHEHVILETIRRAGLEWHIIFNKGAVMVLPAGITKATGLAEALKELDVDPAAVIGIGDAENDHAFLRMCGLSIAVANALPAVKAGVDIVTSGSHGAGVVEAIDLWLSGGFETHQRPASA